ncbi:hypothetical protein CLU79DRAFT_109218 [Phycomyces nitens]|nr:hypothetical protein CLU79DRAFT_109218 [Phycomyces nitens]
MTDGSLAEFIPNHTNTIRDIKRPVYGDLYILSTGLDKTLVLSSLDENRVLQRYHLEAPGWSCNFDNHDPNILYCGLANGTIVVYDIRNPHQPLYCLRLDTSIGPIHSLDIFSDENQYRILCSGLSSSVGWSIGKSNEVPVAIPLIDPEIVREYNCYSSSYQPSSSTFLISLRNREETKHVVGTITEEMTMCPQWSFSSPFPQHNMARTTLISSEDLGTIVAFSVEANGRIVLCNQELLVQELDLGGPVMDIKHCLFQEHQVLAALTLDTLELFSYH